MTESVSVDISMVVVLVAMFVVAPILHIVKMYFQKRWKKDLMDFSIASEVINIYRNHKHIETQKEWFLFKSIESFKSRIKSYFNERKQRRLDKKEYGI